MLGTASPTRGYLLVEEPGAWGPGAVPTSRLGPDTTAALLAVARASSSKLLLVRRPVRSGGEVARRRLFRVTCRRGAEQVLTRECPVEDLAAAADDDDGWAVDGPLLLVCTHGRKDWCCALRGRPLAAAVADLEPERTWECSHLGGCRFAANVLVLPSGNTYGRVDTTDVPDVVAAVRHGQVLPRLLRGRTSDAMVVQAADGHARAALGRTGADDLVPSRAERLDEAGTAWRITLDGTDGGSDVAVELEQAHAAEPRRLTCSAPGEQLARTWRLVGLRELVA